MLNAGAPAMQGASGFLITLGGEWSQGLAMMTVAAPRGVREMSDGELMAMIEKKTGLGG